MDVTVIGYSNDITAQLLANQEALQGIFEQLWFQNMIVLPFIAICALFLVVWGWFQGR